MILKNVILLAIFGIIYSTTLVFLPKLNIVYHNQCKITAFDLKLTILSLLKLTVYLVYVLMIDEKNNIIIIFLLTRKT